MNSVYVQLSSNRAIDVLRSIREKGVHLWSQNGELRYKAPKGSLTQKEVESLRLSRAQIVALLEEAVPPEAGGLSLSPRRRFDRAPLTFSQLVHWQVYRLSERPAIRHIASARRLLGRMDVDALRRSLAEIVRRHDVLRTRIVVDDGVPVQEISEEVEYLLEVQDLTALPESDREVEVGRAIEQFILEPIDPAVGPLFGARLLRLRNHEHVMIVAMEHIISDETSINILLRELFTAYLQASKGLAFSLPNVPIQFADYATWQRNTEASWVRKHGAYWAEHLSGCRRLRFPTDLEASEAGAIGWGSVPVRINGSVKMELQEWCRRRRTTLAMSVFTAYAALVMRWCEVPEVLIQYVVDGRSMPNLENAIGFFASVLYLRMGLDWSDSFIHLIDKVTQEYCQAHENADFSYMAARIPRPQFTRNTAFNWIPRGAQLDLSDVSSPEDDFSCSSIRFAHPMLRDLELDGEPSILLFEAEDEIVGDLYFPLNRFSRDAMERFGRNFAMFLTALIRQPEARITSLLLVK